MKRNKTLDQSFPIYKVEQDRVLSRTGDVTVGFRVELPELFTLSTADYEALHQALIKAIRVLPAHTLVHKQDWFYEARYQADFSHPDASFLSSCSARHFHERPYLEHECYVFLTRRPPGTAPATALSSSLIRSSVVPPAVLDAKELQSFLDKTAQFAHILQESGYCRVTMLVTDELVSSPDKAGLLERYCFLLGKEERPLLKDIEFGNEFRIGDAYCQLFSLADVQHLPAYCGPRMNYDKYSSHASKFPIGFAAPFGQLLACNHIYNQYVWIEDVQLTLKKMETKRLRLQSLSAASRANAVSRDATNDFLNEAVAQGRLPVKSHFNLLVWTDTREQGKVARGGVSAAAAQLDARLHQEVAAAPALFWAGVPGNAGALPYHETFDSFLEHAVCFFNVETSYRSSVSPVGMRLADRLYGKPLLVDISDEPVRMGVCHNRSKFVLGPSGSGKSYWVNAYLRSYVEQGSHAVVVDVGHSYRGLCELLGGYYFTYTESQPLSFNPFYLEDGILDTEKREAIKTLLIALWKREDQGFTRAEYVSLSNALQGYYDFLAGHVEVFPSFNTFYDYLVDQFQPRLSTEGISARDFDITNFLYVLRPFYRGGEFDYLLNAKENLDILSQPFVVFELDAIQNHEVLFPTATIMVMHAFISKMRKLQGVRKIILIEEAWKALMRNGMAEYIKYLFKTVRKFFGEAVVVTQEVEDIISSPIVKQAIINNSDCKILLDQSKYQNKFDDIQQLLGLTDKEKALVLSLNKANDPTRKYKEVFISLGGTISKVYRTEVSLEEHYTYTTEETEKVLVQAYAKRYGSLRRGISMLAAEKRAAAAGTI